MRGTNPPEELCDKTSPEGVDKVKRDGNIKAESHENILKQFKVYMEIALWSPHILHVQECGAPVAHADFLGSLLGGIFNFCVSISGDDLEVRGQYRIYPRDTCQSELL